MSDDRQPPEVGSVAEEAAKLFGAFADLARQQGADSAGTVSGLAGHAAAFAREVNDHVATGDAECRYCPVCRAVHLVRETSPEVRAHLTTAAASLLQAAAGLLESVPPASGSAEPGRRRSAPEHIDLDDVPEAGRSAGTAASAGDEGSPETDSSHTEEDW